jgi:hypothetical protein
MGRLNCRLEIGDWGLVIGGWGEGFGKLWSEEGEGVGIDGRMEMGVNEPIGEGLGLRLGGRALGAGVWQAESTRESKTRENRGKEER